MKLEEALGRFARTAGNGNVSIVVGEAREVDKDKRRFQLVREGFAEVEVEMTAFAESERAGLVAVPKEGSAVVVGLAERVGYAYLLLCSEVAEVAVAIEEGAEVVVSEAGLKVARGGENLMEVISDMIDELNKIVVVQGTTINVAAMEQIKTRFKQLLNA